MQKIYLNTHAKTCEAINYEYVVPNELDSMIVFFGGEFIWLFYNNCYTDDFFYNDLFRRFNRRRKIIKSWNVNTMYNFEKEIKRFRLESKMFRNFWYEVHAKVNENKCLATPYDFLTYFTNVPDLAESYAAAKAEIIKHYDLDLNFQKLHMQLSFLYEKNRPPELDDEIQTQIIRTNEHFIKLLNQKEKNYHGKFTNNNQAIIQTHV